MTEATGVEKKHLGIQWKTTWFLLGSLSIMLKVLQPVLYNFEAKYDDGLLVNEAHSIISGHFGQLYSWESGPLALAKGYGYPFFLTVAHSLLIRPLVLEQLILVAGALLMSYSWYRIRGSPFQSTAILIVVVLNPINFSVDAQRIYRDSFSNSLGTLLAGIAALTGYWIFQEYTFQFARTTSENGKLAKVKSLRVATLIKTVSSSILIGAGCGWLAITKSNWVWAIPAIISFIFYPLMKVSKILTIKVVAPLAALCIFCSGIFYFGVIVSVKSYNQGNYGVSIVENLTSGPFLAAWKSWASVEAGPSEKWIPITKEMRSEVYSVSPTAKVLQPYLETQPDIWKSWVSCTSVVKICNESTGWFQWDMRSAAAASGRVRTVHDLDLFFKKLGTEIDAACTSGRLKCSKSPVLGIGLPRTDQISKKLVVWTTFRGLLLMTTERSLVFEVTNVNRPTNATYKQWQSVIYGMPTYINSSQASSSVLVRLLNGWTVIFGILNCTLLLGSITGILWIRKQKNRLSFSSNRYASSIARWQLTSLLAGLVPLAILQVASFPTYLIPVYWLDFSTPLEIFLIYGFFSFSGTFSSWFTTINRRLSG